MKPQLLLSLKGYKKSDLLHDLMAGLMVAIIALPLSIALGIQSVPAEVSTNGIQFGIITAIVAGFFISAMGGSKHQIGGPTAAFVVILFGYLANPEIGVLGLAIAGIIAGVLLILMGILKAGNVMKFFPYPITIGFTTGVGLTLLIGQIKDFCGFNASGTEAIEKIVSYCENITSFDLATFGVGVLGLLIVLFLPKINKKIPAAFVALIVCTGATLLCNGLLETSIATIGSKYGEVKAGFYPINFGKISEVNFGALIVPSIVIAFLCAIESLLSATVAAGMTGTTFDANQELIGQGVANIGSSLLGGLPATGAIARTAASIENGAKSPLAGIFHALFLLVMYFALMGVLQYIPLTVFAAILISVSINMSRFPLFFKLTRFGVRDGIILLATFALTVVFDLTYGVLGGVAITFLLNIKNCKIGLKIDKQDSAESTTLSIRGALFFLNANKLVDAIANELSPVNELTVDFTALQSIDETAMEKLKGIDKKAKSQGKTLQLINMNADMVAKFNKFYGVI
ncbi:MAG: SulP family inorganic anion transporter [Clostridiales bacterium]|nr:SulP family inorganic anion transporter [Clostridiales bacterium]